MVSTGINGGSNARISSIFLVPTNDNCQSPPRPRTQKWLYLSRLIIPGDYVYVPYPLITSNGRLSVTVVRASLTGNWRANLSNRQKDLKQKWRSHSIEVIFGYLSWKENFAKYQRPILFDPDLCFLFKWVEVFDVWPCRTYVTVHYLSLLIEDNKGGHVSLSCFYGVWEKDECFYFLSLVGKFNY